ncbi:MAG: septum formation protein Maf [Spirochaetes bacterium]|nr:septum formation protein Maf [Spirochaetota bacterium]
MDHLILASKSPRRREILKRIGIPYILCEPDTDESLKDGRNIRSAVIGISKRKVGVVAPRFARGLVLGVDTIVLCRGRVLGKPKNGDEAEEYLRFLNGGCHEVLSGVTVKDSGSGVEHSAVSTTAVYFTEMTRAEIGWYLSLGEWFDKAGGYAIQGSASMFIDRIDGSYYNVMGLPVEQLFRLLKRFSYFSSAGEYRPVKRS